MDSDNNDAKGVEYRRIEVLTVPGRRWKWSDDDNQERAGSGSVVDNPTWGPFCQAHRIARSLPSGRRKVTKSGTSMSDRKQTAAPSGEMLNTSQFKAETPNTI